MDPDVIRCVGVNVSGICFFERIRSFNHRVTQRFTEGKFLLMLYSLRCMEELHRVTQRRKLLLMVLSLRYTEVTLRRRSV
jgi:hypothetical protein